MAELSPEKKTALDIVRQFEHELRMAQASAPAGVEGEITRASCQLQILECRLAEAVIVTGQPLRRPEPVEEALDMAGVERPAARRPWTMAVRRAARKALSPKVIKRAAVRAVPYVVLALATHDLLVLASGLVVH